MKYDLKDVKARSREDIMSHDRIVLWGAGGTCFSNITAIGAEKVSAIFDNNPDKWGGQILGVPVLEPKTELEKYRCQDSAFVISTRSYAYEIARELMDEWGVKEENIFCTAETCLDEYRYRPDVIMENRERLWKVWELLADQESQDYYMNFICSCLARNPLFLKGNPRCIEAYEYHAETGRVGVQGGETILDCGAFNGDTARLFKQKTKDDCEVYCFEPLAGNYAELKEWIEREKIKNVHAYHIGVGERKHKNIVYSAAAKSMMAVIGGRGLNAEAPYRSEVQVDLLDSVMKDKEVGYIKMDIEGAEMSALRGARNVIAQNRPQMLISGYHKITDMWEIPEYVLEIVPDYRVFLGHQPHVPIEPEFIFAI